MDKKIYILVVEDEVEVLDAIVRDIEIFEDKFPIEMAQTAEEARQIIADTIEKEDQFGLFLCDHVLPEENGVDLLIDLHKKEQTQKTKKVLITGQAGLHATVNAVNRAELNHYIAKPWDKDELQKVVRHQLTDYVLENCEDPLPFMQLLESERIAEFIRSDKSITDR